VRHELGSIPNDYWKFMKKLRVLVACEFSGIVRDAFAALGHDAWSCDLLPSEKPGKHLQQNILDHCRLKYSPTDHKSWDLIIAHPPCTYLCNSGVRWLAPGGVINKDRHQKMTLACDFFAALYWANIPQICIENPVMHKYARDYLKSAWKIPTYTQSIQPWQHGHGETKRTCLWLRGLPPLVPSDLVSGRKPVVHFESPGPNRWANRSRTKEGIAKAMAAQWSAYLTNSEEL
jgi:hypothetical protein